MVTDPYRQNLIDILLRLIKDAGDEVSELKIREEMRPLIHKEPHLIDLLFDNWFTRMFPTISIERPNAHSIAVFRERRERRKAKQARIKQIVHTVLMDIVLPNGKQLRRETSNRYLANLGGFYSEIAKRKPPGKAVEAAFTEQDLRNMYGRNYRAAA